MMALTNTGSLKEFQAFPYQPLTERDGIRLLDLFPNPDKSGEIRCELIHTRLSVRKNDIVDHFTALSYVWGRPTDTRLISISGHPVTVTLNLFHALQDLRDETRHLLLWVDALCINQHDNQEKTAQVFMMGEIYATATHTIIHLGHSDDEISALLHFEKDKKDPNRVQISEEQLTTSVLTQPWFTRIWIFQELLQSRDPRVQYGKYCLTWDKFCQSVARLETLVPEHPLMNQKGNIDVILGMQQARDDYRMTLISRRLPSDEFNITLKGLLNSRRGLGVTEPSDMVFAHLGVALDIEDLADLDYSMNCSQIYAAAARHMMEKADDFNLLHHLDKYDSQTRMLGLPSWVPDWTNLDLPLPPSGGSHGFILVPTPWGGYQWSSRKHIDFNLSKAYRREFTFAINNSVFAVKGGELDTITNCSAVISAQHFYSDQYKVITSRRSHLEDFRRTDLNSIYINVPLSSSLAQPHSKLAGPSSPLAEPKRALLRDMYSFWHSVIQDDDIMPPLGYLETQNKDWYEEWGNWALTTNYVRIDGPIHRPISIFRELFSCFDPDFDKGHVQERRVARLKTGRLALVPRSARAGDIIGSSYGILAPYFAVRRVERQMESEAKMFSTLGEFPVIHCKLLGQCLVNPYGLFNPDEIENPTNVHPGREIFEAESEKREKASQTVNELARIVQSGCLGFSWRFIF